MQNHSFRTPFQLLHQWLRDNNRDIGYQQDQPDITQKKDLKTDPHTEIGYLVGYDSTNIFRIWIPSTSEVRRVRDVTFNESIFYDGNDQPPEPIPQRVEVQLPAHIEDESDYEEIPTQIDEPEPDPVEQSPQPQTKETPPRLWYNPNHLIMRTRMIRMSFMTFSTHIRHRTPFREGAHAEWKALQQRGTFRAVPRDQVTGKLCHLPGSLSDKDTYAATLAGRSFRILMAITAKFDLETRQLDAVNAFTNALLEDEEEVYKELTAAFRELGLTQCPDEPCIFQNDWLTVFFFVDDIVFLYRKENEDAADEMVAALKRKYAMTDQGNYNGSLVSESCVTDPTGSFGYAKTPTLKGWFNAITRSDIAKPASKLAEFLNNPSEHHSKLADHLIEYLYATRYLAIQFSGKPCLDEDVVPQLHAQHHSDFQSASDAAFADNKETRKSSQGSILTLFGGPIAWKAALRHVDIHTCWARQAFEKGLYKLTYTPTSQMIADGLTKALPGQKFATFVKQLGLVDISTLLGI
ncbi:reverse transcriptase (RNA-dependent DNA polymerase) [Hirsutella rhossiliensis]